MLAFKMLQELGFLEESVDKLACFGLDSPKASDQDKSEFRDLSLNLSSNSSSKAFLGWTRDPGPGQDGGYTQPGQSEFLQQQQQRQQQQQQQQQQQLGFVPSHGLYGAQDDMGYRGPGLGHPQMHHQDPLGLLSAEGVHRQFGDERRGVQQQQQGPKGGGGGGGHNRGGGHEGQRGATHGLQYPVRPGEPDCQFFLKTHTCAYGMSCKFNHPQPWRQLGSASGEGGVQYPQRPGQPECQFYMANGACKFGMTCKFHHPPLSEGRGSTGSAGARARRPTQGSDKGVGDGQGVGPALNELGYPMRPGEKECAYFLKTGQCKYGATCKFHHPHLRGPHSGGQQQQQQQQQQLLQYPGNGAAPLFQSTPPTDIPPTPPLGVGAPPPSWPLSASVPAPVSGVYPFNQPLLAAPSAVPAPGSAPSGYLPVNQPGLLAHLAYAPQAAPGMLPLTGAGGSALPQRPGAADCRNYLKTGTCRFGAQCKYNHTPQPASASGAEQVDPGAAAPISAPMGDKESRSAGAEGVEVAGPPGDPQNPHSQQHYLGQQLYGQQQQQQEQQSEQAQIQGLRLSQQDSGKAFRLNQYLEQQAKQPVPISGHMHHLHPMTRTMHLGAQGPVTLSALGLPLRPGAPPCPQYLQFAECRYGMLCPLDHPLPTAPGIPGMHSGAMSLSSPSANNGPILESPSSSGRILFHLPSTLSSSAASLAELHVESFAELRIAESPREQGPEASGAGGKGEGQRG